MATKKQNSTDCSSALPTGKQLREKRLLAKKTLAHMAILAGHSIVYLSDMERGRRNVTLKVADIYRNLHIDFPPLCGRTIKEDI